jgi:hypothetical protein
MNFAENILDTDIYYLHTYGLLRTLKMVKTLNQPSYADLRKYLELDSIDDLVEKLRRLSDMGAVAPVNFAEVRITHYGEILIGIAEGKIIFEGAP